MANLKNVKQVVENTIKKLQVKEQIGPGTPTQNVAGTGNLWQYNIDICFDWAANWTMHNAFLNPNANPNQPCNHICQRIDHWSNLNQPGISMVKASRLKCKITHGLQQSQIHSCNC